MFISGLKLIIVELLWTLVCIQESKQHEEVFVTRYFQTVSQVNVTANIDIWTKHVDNVDIKFRCTSLCVEYGCECASFTYDGACGTCHMFTKSLVGGGGSIVGANKVTECSVPKVFSNALLLNYTGCNATYECQFGYNSTVPGTLTCQFNETWLPSAFECMEIPCSTPPTLSDSYADMTSLQVGGIVRYTCNSGYKNRGGLVHALICVLGGTWSGTLDMICKPINIVYTLVWTTANEAFAGTGARIYVTMYGNYSITTIYLPLNKNYNIGATDSHVTTTEDVGPLYKVDVGHDGTDYNPAWKLQSITITMDGVGSYYFDANVWIDDANSKVTLFLR